jgi:hypothetical protein
VLTAIAQRQGQTFAVDSNALLSQAKAKELEALDANNRISFFASRIAERKLRDGLLQHLPERTALLADQSTSVSVSLASPYPTQHQRIKDLRSRNDLAAIIERHPVREAGILDAIAKGLNFSGRADYEKVVLGRLSADESLRDAVQAKMGTLASQLV